MRAVAPARFRTVMGRFATGVTVVTVAGSDGPVGMTANAVCSLSLDPLLLLVCFDNAARTLPIVAEGERFGVNVLAKGQEDVARLFASKTPEHEKFGPSLYSRVRTSVAEPSVPATLSVWQAPQCSVKMTAPL